MIALGFTYCVISESTKYLFSDSFTWQKINHVCYFFAFFLLFLRNNNKSSSQQSSSSSSSSSLSSCSSSSALAQELSQQTAVIPESDSNSQVDWTYDPNEPRYCICNQVRMASKLKYNYRRCSDVAELSSLNVNFEQTVFLLLNFWSVFIYLLVMWIELLKVNCWS